MLICFLVQLLLLLSCGYNVLSFWVLLCLRICQVTLSSSLEAAKAIRRVCGKKPPVLLIGNKDDLDDEDSAADVFDEVQNKRDQRLPRPTRIMLIPEGEIL